MRQLLRITATFALALVFSAGMAFGQSQEIEEGDLQSGVNDARVTQAGSNTNATVTQNGGQKAARVNQSGSDNDAIVTQTGANKSIAELEQTLGSAKANINIGVAAGKISTVRLSQEGNNFADIDVTSNDEISGVGGQAFAKQINTGGKNGTENRLYAEQFSGANLSALQEGENNMMDIYQDGVGELEARQVGDNNVAFFKSEGQGGTFGNLIEQFGNGNTARVKQASGNFNPGGNSTGAEAVVTQNNGGNTLKGIGDDFANQGEGATLTVTQGGDAMAEVEQGAFDTATITQSANDVALVDQSGNNTATITQNP